MLQMDPSVRDQYTLNEWNNFNLIILQLIYMQLYMEDFNIMRKCFDLSFRKYLNPPSKMC